MRSINLHNDSRRLRVCLYLAWILLQLPFLSSALRVDDTYHLAVARQLSAHPFDPYGFEMNWHGTPEPVFQDYASPPLVPAWLAVWTLVFPWNEISLHLAMLPFSLGALHAFGRLASSFNVGPLSAMVLLCCSPAFLLGSQVLMPDVAMLSLFLLTLSYASVYEEQPSRVAFVIAALAAGLCPLAKYNGVVLVPLLLWMTVVSKRKRQMAIIALVPLVSLIVWNGFTWIKYGAAHVLAMTLYERNPDMSTRLPVIAVGVLAATGLGVLPVSLGGFLLGAVWRKRSTWTIAVLSFTCFFWLAAHLNYDIVSAFLFAASVTITLLLVAFTISQGRHAIKDFDPQVLTLVIWILVGLAFQRGLMFSAVRYVLFLAPPAILLLLRQSEWVPSKKLAAVVMALNLIFVVAMAVGDACLANIYRDAVAHKIAPLLKERTGRFYFGGHWGFQYYAEQIGGKPYDLIHPPVLQKGDLVAIACTPWPRFFQPTVTNGQVLQTTGLTVPFPWVLRTMACGAGVNFYGNAIQGCSHPTFLPFGFSREPGETFLLHFIEDSLHRAPTVKEGGARP